MPRKPSVTELRTAVEWLRAYEDRDDDTNGVECRRVAAWLEEIANKMDVEARLKQVAEEQGIPLATVRMRFKDHVRRMRAAS